jgi:hypothetical protein
LSKFVDVVAAAQVEHEGGEVVVGDGVETFDEVLEDLGELDGVGGIEGDGGHQVSCRVDRERRGVAGQG